MFGFDGPFDVDSDLTISPATVNVISGTTQLFTAVGGTGSGYVFSILVNNSGGSINPTSGLYTAGAVSGVTDTVRVTDDGANTDDAAVAVLPEVVVLPSNPIIAPLDFQVFIGTGGSGFGYTFALTINNSGGSIDSITGAYTAGTTGDVVDTVEVTDSLGFTGTTTVNVGPEVSITPEDPTFLFGTTHLFTAAGGSGVGYVWSISVNNSGGTINAFTGSYTAGPISSVTDTIEVVDSLGNIGETDVEIDDLIAVWDVTISPDTQGSLRFTMVDGAAFDFLRIQEGDLAYIYGDEFAPTNTNGTYTITRVSVTWVDGDQIAWFEIQNPLGEELIDIEQILFEDLMFFRPKRRTIYDSPRRVIVCEKAD